MLGSSCDAASNLHTALKWFSSVTSYLGVLSSFSSEDWSWLISADWNSFHMTWMEEWELFWVRDHIASKHVTSSWLLHFAAVSWSTSGIQLVLLVLQKGYLHSLIISWRACGILLSSFFWHTQKKFCESNLNRLAVKPLLQLYHDMWDKLVEKTYCSILRQMLLGCLHGASVCC